MISIKLQKSHSKMFLSSLLKKKKQEILMKSSRKTSKNLRIAVTLGNLKELR
jgi:hypothetical protein